MVKCQQKLINMKKNHRSVSVCMVALLFNNVLSIAMSQVDNTSLMQCAISFFQFFTNELQAVVIK